VPDLGPSPRQQDVVETITCLVIVYPRKPRMHYISIGYTKKYNRRKTRLEGYAQKLVYEPLPCVMVHDPVPCPFLVLLRTRGGAAMAMVPPGGESRDLPILARSRLSGRRAHSKIFSRARNVVRPVGVIQYHRTHLTTPPRLQIDRIGGVRLDPHTPPWFSFSHSGHHHHYHHHINLL
jgi:hypothetical protein